MVTAHAGIGTVALSPVVHNAVAQVNDFCFYGVLVFGLVISLPSIASSAKTGCTILNVDNHVVMERSLLATPDAAVTVLTLGVTGIGQSLTQRTPLHGEVTVVIVGGYLVDTPRERTVVK